MHTHYDNLKVARNAPPEVIRAAYKSLSQKYHPDRNPNNPEALRIMAIINASYGVLSDPKKRLDHDLWIEEQEQVKNEPSKSNQSQRNENLQPKIPIKTVTAHILNYWILYLILFGFIWGLIDNGSNSSTQSKPYKFVPYNQNLGNGTSADELLDSPENQAPQTRNMGNKNPTYQRPLYAPNGESWPTKANYVQGYPKLNTKGRSSVTIDNHQNDSDVFVKLVYLDSAEAHPVRQFYIPAYGEFTLENINAGQYDVRYRDLNTGGLSRSESFELTEIALENGVQFSRYTMTLYKVRNGNMQTYGLSEEEF